MPNYIINKQPDNKGYNEVHTTTCGHLPAYFNQQSLGWFTNAVDAVSYAKTIGYPYADGCYYCSREAHHG